MSVEAQKFRSSAAWKRARNIVLNEETVCGLCGQPVDTTLPKGFDYSPEVDHIIPIEQGGHPVDRKNLVLMHRICNRKKGDKILGAYDRQKIIESLSTERYRSEEDDWSEIF